MKDVGVTVPGTGICQGGICMKKLLGIILPLLLVLCLPGCAFTKSLRFASASIGGNYYLFAQALSDYMENDTGRPIDVVETAGSAENLQLISENKVHMAVVQADMVSEAVENGEVGFGAVSELYTEYFQAVTLADSGITSIADLKGKKVSVGGANSGTEKNARQIMEAYGVTSDLADMVNLSYSESAEALEKGEIDAMFFMSGIPASVFVNLAMDKKVRLLPVEGVAADSLKEVSVCYTPEVIPAGIYGGDEDVATVGVKCILLTSDRLSSETVRKLTEVLYTHENDFKYVLPIRLELGHDEIPVKLHPGAESYYDKE